MGIPQSVLNKLKKLDSLLEKLLIEAITRGEVFIMTNAVSRWIDYSTKLYMCSYIDICQIPTTW